MKVREGPRRRHRVGDLESNPASHLDLLSDGVMATQLLTVLLHGVLAAWSCELFHGRAETPENWFSGGNTVDSHAAAWWAG